MTHHATAPPQNARLILILCWIAVILDGYDLVVFGALIPTLTAPETGFMSLGEATFVSTISLIGMTLGALATGFATNRFGRRRVLIGTVFGFSLATLACGFANSWQALGFYRFLAGVGLGGCLPTAIVMVTELSQGQAGRASTRVMTGYHIGAVLTAALAIALLPQWSWRALFVLGAVPGFILGAVMLKALPNSAPTAPSERARAPNLLAGSRLFNLLAICAASFMGLILVYGLNTWLPKLMIAAGYDLHAGLALLLVLNGGGVAGLLASGPIADKIGLKPAVILWFGLGALLLAALSVKLQAAALYPVVFLTGAVVFSAQVLVYAYVAQHYPAQQRAAALGYVAGIGRLGAITGPLLGGVMVTYGIGHPWGFYAFAAIALIAMCAALLWRRA